MDKKKEEAEALAERPKVVNDINKPSRSRKEERRLEAERRNELNKRIRPLKKKLEDVEAEIAKLEQKKAKIEDVMAEIDFYEDVERVKKASLEFDEIKKTLVDLMHQWEDYASRIEVAEGEL